MIYFRYVHLDHWRLNPPLSGGGPLMDLGICCVQICRYVSEIEPISITAQFGPVNDPFQFSEVEESITWQMEFPGKILANSCTSYGFNVDRLYRSAKTGKKIQPG